MKSLPFDPSIRRSVWIALSDLFLDTDTALSRDWRARELAASPFSVDELERILIEEVYPVCRMNLWSVAGEWAGFDPDWLEQQIVARAHSRFRPFRALNLGRLTVPRSSEWMATKRLVARLRGDGAPAAA